MVKRLWGASTGAGRERVRFGGSRSMSDDKTRLGHTPSSGSGAHARPTPEVKPAASEPQRPAEGSGSIRAPNEATIVLGQSAAKPAIAPVIPLRTDTLP